MYRIIQTEQPDFYQAGKVIFETENYRISGDFIYYGPGMNNAIRADQVERIIFVSEADLLKEKERRETWEKHKREYVDNIEEKQCRSKARWIVLATATILVVVCAILCAIILQTP